MAVQSCLKPVKCAPDVSANSFYTLHAMAGQGRCTHADGSYYEGHWAAGERVRGRLMSADGSTAYTGDWKGSARHGQGVQFHKGLFKYTGWGHPSRDRILHAQQQSLPQAKHYVMC